LMLSPPESATVEDDGLLTASEIAQLRLDADWVVLSACNTAAGVVENGKSAEALSGLARAFFYAGVRTLLVSHWYIDSQSTVDVITGTFEAMKTDPTIDRAEALRRSMLNLMQKNRSNAHPGYWASFAVVGESGAGGSASAPARVSSHAAPRKLR